MTPDVATDAPAPTPQPQRPKTVGECRGGVRPCPWVSCRFNLLLDVDKNGNLTLNVPKAGGQATRVKTTTPDEEFEQVANEAIDTWFGDEPVKSCLIDEVTDPKTLQEVSELLCITRERVRQIEEDAIPKLSRAANRLKD